eukprot:gene6605-7298_t
MVEKFGWRIVLLLSWLSISIASLSASSSRVVEVNASNYSSFVSGGKSFLLEFYAPWCPSCLRLEAPLQSIAEALQETDKDFLVGRVDTAASPALARLFSVEFIPAFFLRRDGLLYQLKDSSVSQPEDIAHFCMEGYSLDEPLPLLASPLGPVGKVKTALLAVGLHAIDSLRLLQDTFHLQPWQAILAALMLMVTSLVAGTTLAVALAWYFLKIN